MQKETIQFCKIVLNTDIFPKGDYRELLELTLMYLIPVMVFQIRAPGCVSHSRFMAKAIYYLKIQILGTQLPNDFTFPQKKELKAMAEFVSVLRTALPSATPFQDIKAYWQMVQYKEYIDNHGSKRVLNAIESTLKSMERHSWYLDETLVPLEPDVDDVERRLQKHYSPNKFLISFNIKKSQTCSKICTLNNKHNQVLFHWLDRTLGSSLVY